MIKLNQTALQYLQVISAQNGLVVDVSYSDKTTSDFPGDSQVALITTATTTTVCATPSVGAVRYIDYISIVNTFAGSHTITLQKNSGGIAYPIVKDLVLSAGDKLEYTHADGIKVIDSSGSIHTILSATLANLADTIHAATAKTTPVTADEFGIWDSVSLALRKSTWGNIVTTLQTAFASLTFSVGTATAAGHATPRSMGLVSNITYGIDGNITLTTSHTGSQGVMNQTASYTATLPDVASNSGKIISLMSINTGVLSVIRAGTDTISTIGGNNLTSVNLNNGGHITLVSSGGAWVQIAGDMRISGTWTPTFSAGLTGTPTITASYATISQKTYQVEILISGTTACAAGTTFTQPFSGSKYSTGLVIDGTGVILSGLMSVPYGNPAYIGTGWASSSQIKIISYIGRTD